LQDRVERCVCLATRSRNGRRRSMFLRCASLRPSLPTCGASLCLIPPKLVLVTPRSVRGLDMHDSQALSSRAPDHMHIRTLGQRGLTVSASATAPSASARPMDQRQPARHRRHPTRPRPGRDLLQTPNGARGAPGAQHRVIGLEFCNVRRTGSPTSPGLFLVSTPSRTIAGLRCSAGLRPRVKRPWASV
jgi:hypothetical protein